MTQIGSVMPSKNALDTAAGFRHSYQQTRTEENSMNRREFIKNAAITGAGLLILPSGTLRGQNAPSNKLNIALVGSWGRGAAHFDSLATENVAAICDINEDHLAFGAKRFPDAKTYID